MVGWDQPEGSTTRRGSSQLADPLGRQHIVCCYELIKRSLPA
jgi:hypothetical protein